MTVKQPSTMVPPWAVESPIRAAGLLLMNTVADPLTIVSGGPTHTAMSPRTDAGRKPINTVGTPGDAMGPPTCGFGPSHMGQTCMSVSRAAGGIVSSLPLEVLDLKEFRSESGKSKAGPLSGCRRRYIDNIQDACVLRWLSTTDHQKVFLNMPSPPTPEPLPPVRELLNLGIILECPFLHQLALPTILNTVVISSQKDGPAQGATAYTYAGTRLTKSVFTGGGAEKIVEYHYTPSDPSEKIAIHEAEIAKSKDELREAKLAKDTGRMSTVKNRIDLQKSDLKKLKKQAKDKSFNPMVLQRTTFVENSPGQVGVSGETVFEYDGANIVKATTSSQTDEDPPRIADVAREYKYNDLGQLSEMDMAGCITEFSYAPTGQLLKSSGGFVSPTGDFICEDTCIYTYAPPGSNPIAPNALIASLTDAKSGPASEFGIPSPTISEEEKAAGGVPTVDPGAQMSKLTEKKKQQQDQVADSVDSSSGPAKEKGSGFLSKLVAKAKGTSDLPVVESPAAALVEESSAAATAVVAPSIDPMEVPLPETTTTRVTGVYVYA